MSKRQQIVLQGQKICPGPLILGIIHQIKLLSLFQLTYQNALDEKVSRRWRLTYSVDIERNRSFSQKLNPRRIFSEWMKSNRTVICHVQQIPEVPRTGNYKFVNTLFLEAGKYRYRTLSVCQPELSFIMETLISCHVSQ